MFVHYAAKAEQFFGVTRSRAIYQKAIEVLPNAQASSRSFTSTPAPTPACLPLRRFLDACPSVCAVPRT